MSSQSRLKEFRTRSECKPILEKISPEFWGKIEEIANGTNNKKNSAGFWFGKLMGLITQAVDVGLRLQGEKVVKQNADKWLNSLKDLKENYTDHVVDISKFNMAAFLIKLQEIRDQVQDDCGFTEKEKASRTKFDEFPKSQASQNS